MKPAPRCTPAQRRMLERLSQPGMRLIFSTSAIFPAVRTEEGDGAGGWNVRVNATTVGYLRRNGWLKPAPKHSFDAWYDDPHVISDAGRAALAESVGKE